MNRILCNILATALEFGTVATGANAGEVIQVVTATDSTQRSTTSDSFVTASNTLSVTITPSSASNKIFIIASIPCFNGTTDANTHVTIYRGATNLGTADYGFGGGAGGHASNEGIAGISILDSPSTTSATTYQIYFKRFNGGTAFIIRQRGNDSLATITCMEVKG